MTGQLSFSILETRQEWRQRAKQISHLLGMIEDAPKAIECWQGQSGLLDYFIKRAKAKKFDPNDRDGLQRMVGDISGLLTERDRRQMIRNPRIWRRYIGPFKHWCGRGTKDKFCTTLHAKEIAYLEQARDSIANDIASIRHNAAAAAEELARLRAVGPLNAKDAAMLNLTIDGYRKAK